MREVDDEETSIPSEIAQAVDAILRNDSAPNRQFLITIAAGTADAPETNPGAIQLPAGVDRRSQAKGPRDALAAFLNEHGLVLKVSRDPGVSNQWRETEIDEAWVFRRRAQDRGWAQAFLTIVEWLRSSERRGADAQRILESVLNRVVRRASANVLNYPRFRADPRVASDLVRTFVATAPNRPDALEAIAAAVCRSIAKSLGADVRIQRGDINSPDAIDILIELDGATYAGVEVTDDALGLAKLEHEVLPAMQRHGLGQATVLATLVAPAEADAIEAWRSRMLVSFGQRIDIVDLEQMLGWLSIPLLAEDTSTQVLQALGIELDEYGSDGNRHMWMATLNRYVEEVLSQT